MDESGQLGPSAEASVLLDIGGDVGALIIETGADLHLVEIEVSRVDGGEPVPPEMRAGHHHHDHGSVPHTHVAVRERRGPQGSQWAAIYPALYQGEYHVHRPDGSTQTVTVTGGEIATLDWR